MYLNFGYFGFKELIFLNCLLKLQIRQQGKSFPHENKVVAICLCFVILTLNQIQYGAFKRARTVKKWRHDSSSSRILCLLFL